MSSTEHFAKTVALAADLLVNPVELSALSLAGCSVGEFCRKLFFSCAQQLRCVPIINCYRALLFLSTAALYTGDAMARRPTHVGLPTGFDSPARLRNNYRLVVRTHMPLSPRVYYLVPVKGQ